MRQRFSSFFCSAVHLLCLALVFTVGLDGARGASDARPKITSAEELREWLAGTTWRNEKNKIFRFFDKGGVRRGAKGTLGSFRAIDAKRVEAKFPREYTFTFDDDYQTFTSSDRDQRFVLAERAERETGEMKKAAETAQVESARSTDAAAKEPVPDIESAEAPSVAVKGASKKTKARRTSGAQSKPKPGKQAETKKQKKQAESEPASWRDAGWVRPVIAVAGFLFLLFVGSVVDFLQRPPRPHENFTELSASEDRLERRSTMGLFALCITSLFGGIGAMLLFSALVDDGDVGIFWALPILFLAVGVFPAGLRNTTVIDRGKGAATSTSSFCLIPFSSHAVPLADILSVRLEKIISKSESGGQTNVSVSYAVSLLHGEDDVISFTSNKVYSDALARGAHIAKWLGVDLKDTESGSVKTAVELDKSLKERLREAGEVVEMPSSPEGCRIVVEMNGNEVVLTLPGRTGAAAARKEYSQPGMRPEDLELLPGPLRGALKLVGTLSSGNSESSHVDVDAPKSKTPNDEQITVSPDGLTVRIEDAGGCRVEEHPADEIEELRFIFEGSGDPSADRMERRMRKMAGRGVRPEVFDKYMDAYRAAEERSLAALRLDQDALLLRGDRGTLEFGRGLNQAEAQWLYDLIRYVLSR